MKICIVGIGYVGLVTAGGLAEGGNDVVCVDNDEGKIERLKQGQIPIYEPGLTEIVMRNEKLGRLRFTTNLTEGVDECEIIVLAVGTPSSPDGSADISAILSVSEEIAQCMKEYRIIVTKSTVPVGTGKKVSELVKSKTDVPFDYVSNPEFLKEGAAVADFMSPDRIIIGTEKESVREKMQRLYGPFMRKGNRILFMDTPSAEMSKYASNVMLATRITFMNELSALCEELGADINSVRQGIGSDSRIGRAFLFPGVGYGGSCFPKDVRALIYMAEQENVPLGIAQAVKEGNLRQQQRFAQRVIDHYKGQDNVTLAVWGITFKANTDDTRESPALFCIERFLEAGLNVKAYDPEGKANGLTGNFEQIANSYDALQDADGLIVLTDWQEFRNPDFEKIATLLKTKTIFDGRNLYDPAFMKEKGFTYFSVGRA